MRLLTTPEKLAVLRVLEDRTDLLASGPMTPQQETEYQLLTDAAAILRQQEVCA